jgi:hypothetical protein
MRKAWSIVLTAGLATLSSGRTGHADGPEWTVFLYWAADDDVEKEILADLRPHLDVGSTDKVKIVGLVDRSSKGDTDASRNYSSEVIPGITGDWDDTKLLSFGQGRVTQVRMPPDDVVELDMTNGVADTDADEMHQGLPRCRPNVVGSRFDAGKWVLVAAGHGNAWRGVCGDESAGSGAKLMSLARVVEQLQQLRALRGGRPLDVLVLEACDMSTFDVACALVDGDGPLANCLVAGEGKLFGSTLNHAAVLQALRAAPTTLPKDLARSYVDTYCGQGCGRDNPKRILAAFDVSGASGGSPGAVGEALDAYARSLAGVDKKRIARIRAKCKHRFAASSEPGVPIDMHVDAGDLYPATRLVLGAAHPATTAARNVGVAAQAMRIGTPQAALDVRTCTGLSIAFPCGYQETREYLNATQASASVARTWRTFLEEYPDPVTGCPVPGILELEQVVQVTDPDGTIHLTGGVNRASWAVTGQVLGSVAVTASADPSGAAVSLGGLPLRESDAGEPTTWDWDGRWFAVSCGGSWFPASISAAQREDALAFADVPISLRRAGDTQWRPCYLRVLLRPPTPPSLAWTGEIAFAWTRGPRGSGLVRLGDQDRLRGRYPEVGGPVEPPLTHAAPVLREEIVLGTCAPTLEWRVLGKPTAPVFLRAGFLGVHVGGTGAFRSAPPQPH